MIQLLQGFPENVVALAGSGRTTRADYDTVVIPAVEAAFARHRGVRLYYGLATNFDGIEAAAAWKDFLVGMRHLRGWERIAVATDLAWIGHALQLFDFLMPGRLRVFGLPEIAAARAWIAASES